MAGFDILDPLGSFKEAIIEALEELFNKFLEGPIDDIGASLDFITKFALTPMSSDIEAIGMFYLALVLLVGISYAIVKLIAHGLKGDLWSNSTRWLVLFFIPNRMLGIGMVAVGPEFYTLCAVSSVILAALILTLMSFSIIEIMMLVVLAPMTLVSSFLPTMLAMLTSAWYLFMLVSGQVLIRAGGALLFLFPRSRIIVGLTKVFFANTGYPIFVATVLLLFNITAHTVPLPAIMEAFMVPAVMTIISVGYILILLIIFIVRSTNREEITTRASQYTKKGTVIGAGVATVVTGGGAVATLGVMNTTQKLLGADTNTEDEVEKAIERRKRRYSR